MFDLAEPLERIAFAKAEAAELTPKVDAFTAASVSVFPRIVGHRSYKIFLRQDAPFPTALAAKAGMIANEARSCLDSLACILAVRNRKTPNGVYFPISKSAAIFADDGEYKMRKLAETDKQKVRGLEPFQGGHNILWRLHEADRTRKHQRLQTSLSQPGAVHVAGHPVIGLGARARPTVIFEGCTFNGHYIDRLDLKAGQLGQITQTGVEIEVGEGRGFPPPINLFPRIAYSEPDTLAGVGVLIALDEGIAEVERIIRMFA